MDAITENGVTTKHRHGRRGAWSWLAGAALIPLWASLVPHGARAEDMNIVVTAPGLPQPYPFGDA